MDAFFVSDLYFDYEFVQDDQGDFTDVLGFPAKGTFTLENYKNAFQELDYIRSFMNSLLITVVTAVLVLLISAMAAWVLVRYKTKASKIIFLIFAGSMLIPFQCVMLPLVGFASKIGLLSRGGLIFMYMGFQTSMAIIMFHGFIKIFRRNWRKPLQLTGVVQYVCLFQSCFL